MAGAPNRFRVGLVQMAMATGTHENLERAASRVEEAARAGAEVVCLPELYRSPYFCQREDQALFDLAETVPGPSTERLGEVARRAGVAVPPRFARARQPRCPRWHDVARSPARPRQVTACGDGTVGERLERAPLTKR